VPKRNKGTYETRINKQCLQAEEQICRYAEAQRVEALRQGLQLHKIIMLFDGYKLLKMDAMEKIS